MIRRPPPPSARADSMNGKPITSSTAARTTRANAGTMMIPIAIIAFRRVAPSRPAITIASTSPGTRRGCRRRASAAGRRSRRGSRRGGRSACRRRARSRSRRAPTWSDTCAPWMIRASVSRPRSSVPNGCAQLGAEQPVGVGRVRVDRPDEAAEERRQDAEADDRRADDPDRVAPARGDQPPARHGLPGGRRGRRAHVTLILGSSRP